MIYHKLFITEQRLKKALDRHVEKLEAFDKIKHYLALVDENVEVISAATAMELEVLLRELKGAPLTELEYELIVEIITNEN